MEKIKFISKDIQNAFSIESWAGASTKISGYIGMIYELSKKKYNPDIIIGTSSGSIASLMRISLMINPHKMGDLVHLAKNFDLEDIFNISPVNKKGKIRPNSLFRLFRGKLSMGEHNKLVDTLKDFFTEEVYSEYIKGDYPDLLLCSTNINNGSFNIENAKDLSYEDIFHHVLASTSIPVATQPLYISNDITYDAGVRFSNPGCYLIHKMIKNGYHVSSHKSFYSRPQDISGIISKKVNVDSLKDRLFFKGAAKVAGRCTDIYMFQNSKFCEWLEEYQSDREGYDLQQFFLPKILDSTYDVDQEQLEKLFYLGRTSIAKFK